MKAKIQEDIKTAMKARDQKKLDTLRMIMSEIKRVEVDTRKEVDEAGVITILQKEIKKRKDALDFAKQAQRADLVEQNEYEIALAQSYLGEQFGADELKDLIKEIVAQGNDNIGKIMGALNKDYKGKFDGRMASDIAKEILAQ
ncbi:MAG: GatB/YqeY domain-containing protein [Deltaproteobacteria bacterium]|nr:GatB/YqeY domain-containing protein [Deltaproteobacteria bacterium]